MKLILILLTLMASPALASLETQNRCYIDTTTNTNATGVGAALVAASATRACLLISNKSGSLDVYVNPIASTAVGDGLVIRPNTTLVYPVVPTNALYLWTTGAAAAVGIQSGYIIK